MNHQQALEKRSLALTLGRQPPFKRDRLSYGRSSRYWYSVGDRSPSALGSRGAKKNNGAVQAIASEKLGAMVLEL